MFVIWFNRKLTKLFANSSFNVSCNELNNMAVNKSLFLGHELISLDLSLFFGIQSLELFEISNLLYDYFKLGDSFFARLGSIVKVLEVLPLFVIFRRWENVWHMQAF